MTRLSLLAIWCLCLLSAAIALPWMLAAAIAGSPRAWRLAIAFDELGNAATGGQPYETISARAWRWRMERTWARVLVALLLKVDPDHFEGFPE